MKILLRAGDRFQIMRQLGTHPRDRALRMTTACCIRCNAGLISRIHRPAFAQPLLRAAMTASFCFCAALIGSPLWPL